MKMQESGDNEEGTSTRSGNLIRVSHNSTARPSNGRVSMLRGQADGIGGKSVVCSSK
ncbi:MAG: hypothetical protein ACYTDW_17270 [Planctomycetota bacterium]